ncbi:MULTISPECIES: lipopolysaccharide assembly protein LapB [unclassified Vibrio]|uniref:tetratricopeptide repeat protein n=1 Tax=unclassified Vibrio TaxID=2614977 RepID=UPI00159D8D6C|nr:MULTISPECIES: tetratricopeptide repeat protein [unclassified Vibrio]NVN82776.1 MSHA biogenesis protein MshN [Vibrio sp. Scap16]QLE93306.1 MSHA biogenesis protein MshN [Vibrio sp. Scap24]
MSVINNALSELAKKKSATSIEAAVVPKVKTRSPFVWVAAGFTLSLAMGGWAISQGPAVDSSISTRDVQVAVVDNAEDEPKTIVTPLVSSPTKKLVTIDSANLSADNATIVKSTQTQFAKSESVVASTQVVTKPQATPKSQSVPKAEVAKPIYVASAANKDAKSLPNDSKAFGDSENSGIMIEQVELTSEQLSINAQGRAQKALDANDLDGALKGYNEALRYAPRNEDVRQKLAILYFGKGDTRKAYELYQSGIKLNNNSEKLRLGLSKLLVKADQSEAALSPLIHLPPNPTQDYLAMRAALSQKSQQEEIALESYQKLVEIDSDNARWWLGLAIQQERQLDFTAAKQSYQGALVRVGISSQSQSFVRDRLKIINALEESSDAN